MEFSHQETWYPCIWKLQGTFWTLLTCTTSHSQGVGDRMCDGWPTYSQAMCAFKNQTWFSSLLADVPVLMVAFYTPHPPKKMTANLRRGMEICLHLTYFFLSEMFHCYKTGIYFDWILKLVQRLQPVLSVRAITYPLWTSTDTTLTQ